jgi:hypothetical protein
MEPRKLSWTTRLIATFVMLACAVVGSEMLVFLSRSSAWKWYDLALVALMLATIAGVFRKKVWGPYALIAAQGLPIAQFGIPHGHGAPAFVLVALPPIVVSLYLIAAFRKLAA